MATFRFDGPAVSEEDRRSASKDEAKILGVLNALHLQIKELEQTRETPVVLEALHHLHPGGARARFRLWSQTGCRVVVVVEALNCPCLAGMILSTATRTDE